MAELEWEKQASREEAAALLRRIADGLESGGSVKLEEGGWELKLSAPEQLEVELELEIAEGETELEIELSWGAGAGETEDDEEEEEEEREAAGELEDAGT